MISVVLASCRSADRLHDALTALLPQCRTLDAELIVARTNREPGEAADAALPEGCRLVRCPTGATIPEIRGAGLTAATGKWVALTEDNCVATPEWLTRLASGFTDGKQVVGGTMGNARPTRAIDGGAAFAEYGFFGPFQTPPRPGAPPLVTGANVAYHCSIVADVAAWALAGDWEDVIHLRLARRGAGFQIVPGATVEQNLSYAFGPFCRDRYEHGRDYARVRSRDLPRGRRLLLAATTPLLPPLLASRIWRNAGRAAPAAFLRSLPWTLAFLAAWAGGEAVGYLVPRSTP